MACSALCRLFCSGCHKEVHRHAQDVVECAGCHRWFHPGCHKQYYPGSTGPDEEQAAGDAPWYHTGKCEKVSGPSVGTWGKCGNMSGAWESGGKGRGDGGSRG